MDKDLLKTLTQDLNKVTSKNDLMNLKSKFLGKKGLISELTSELKNLSIDEKKNRGAEIIEHRGKSSAASAASAIYDHVNALVNGSDDWESMGIMSSNPYNIDDQ